MPTSRFTLNFIGDDGELYSHRHTTDENGCIHFEGSTRGEYRAAFSYFPVRPATVSIRSAWIPAMRRPIIMTVEPLAKEFRSAIVITGMLADAKGSDTNNEYIQFMALEEIDFAQTPYCVIACRNNKVNAKGWVQGSYVTYKFNLTSGRAAKGHIFSMSAVSTSGSTAIRVRTSAAPTGFAVSTTIRRPGPTASATRPPDSFTTTTATAIKNIADGIAVFKGTEVDERVSRATRSSTAPPLPRTSQPGRLRLPDSRQRSLQHTKNLLSGVGQPSSGREPIRSFFPDGGNDAGEFVFSAAVLRRAVTIAAVRLSAGSWPPMLRIARRHRKRGRRYDLSLIPEGGALRLSLSDCLKALSERKGLLNSIFAGLIPNISFSSRRSGSDRAS